jgi:hypothetical protein
MELSALTSVIPAAQVLVVRCEEGAEGASIEAILRSLRGRDAIR